MWKLFKGKEYKESNFSIEKNKIPKHIAIIMDGNGRWAEERKLPRTMGHKAGVETLKKIVREASDIGIKYLTAYSFSTENWKRSEEEVSGLMNLLVEFLRRDLKEMHENNIIINTLGDISKLPKPCIDILNESKEMTKNNTGMVLNLALNYGGRQEIVYAVRNIFKDYEDGKISKDIIANLKEEDFSNYIFTKGMPDPDIIIRPSGEQRLSNFMLWQCAYSEFLYNHINWPEFTIEDFHKAIEEYNNRDRRYGGTK